MDERTINNRLKATLQRIQGELIAETEQDLEGNHQMVSSQSG